METTIHKFEAAGLGKAPFKFVGMIEQDLCYGQAILNREEYQRTGIAVTTKPGGTCDYCHTYIVDMFKVRSSDGRTFKVGRDCIQKVGDAGLRKSLAPALRKLSHSRDDARIARAQALLTDEVKATLAAQPHPYGYMAAKGFTLLSFVEFNLERGGRTGQVKAARAIEAAAKK